MSAHSAAASVPGASPARLLHGTGPAVAPPLSLYVHIPWCVRKCPYCDFNSHEWRDASGSDLPEARYLEALVADLEATLPLVWGRTVHTIFIGGGTPSLFGGGTIDALLASIRARLRLAPDAEITLEANPGTVEAGRFRDYRRAGVNRLSLGIQSFDPGRLRALGRIHDDGEARAAVGIAAEVFENFNLDLMYALPGQDLAGAESDLRIALASGAPHLSAYHLTIEPNTQFHRRPPPLPDEDTAAAIHDRVEALLVEAGYDHYETSAYARPAARSRHNLNYWQFGDYLGIGAGAHSKLTVEGRVLRQVRLRTPRDYMAAAPAGRMIAESHEVAPRDLGFEFMMNALRLAEGFAVADFGARTGLALARLERPLKIAAERGLIDRDAFHIRPTPLGRRFLNDLLELFLPADEAPE